MRWRVIPLEKHNAYFNMAIDETVVEGIMNKTSPPTMRFYTWSPSAVSIGRFQSMEDEVDPDKCNELGINYVRRITGGGAVYHDSDGEITYSIIGPQDYFPKGIRESYEKICSYAINGLSRLGIESQFVPINDIIVNGKKISGNAQTRKGGVLLQHGTILYSLDVAKMFTVLRVSKEKISDKMIKGVEERVTCITRYNNASLKDLSNALFKGFVAGKDYEMGSWSEKELSRADKLAETVYSTREWNFSR